MNSNDQNETVPQPPDPRSIDDFLTEAYAKRREAVPWRYWLAMTVLGLVNASDSAEVMCLSFVLADGNFDSTILRNTAWRASLLASAVFFGMLLGGLCSGNLSDIYGRKAVLSGGLCIEGVAGVLSAFSTNVYQISFLRAVAGIGLGASIPPLFALVSESAPRNKRGFFVTYIATFWMIGSTYVALAAFLVFQQWQISWRFFAVLCAVPATLAAVLVPIVVDESPRYLILQNRLEEALHAANNLARKMGSGYPTVPDLTDTEVLFHYPKLERSRSEETERTHQNGLGLFWKASIEFAAKTVDLYRADTWRTTVLLQITWATLSFCSYGIATWIYTLFKVVHLQNRYLNALIFNLANFPFDLITIGLMDRLKRQTMMFWSASLSVSGLLAFAYFASTPNASGNASTLGVVLSACLYHGSVTAVWNTIDTLTPEHFPTKVRSTGIGVASASSRIAAMAAQFVNARLVNRPTVLLLTAGGSLMIAGVTPLLLPNKDMTLQSLKDGDIHDERESVNDEKAPTETTGLLNA